MYALQQIDLSVDPAARQFVKDELVHVTFATVDGVLQSGEGPNHFVVGDAVITSETGERWVVMRARFEDKYHAAPPNKATSDGLYRSNPIPVWAKEMPEPFSIARRLGGDTLHGAAGDWLLQYGPGDYGVAVRARFLRVYRALVPRLASRAD